MSLAMALLISVIVGLAYLGRRIGGDPQLERPIVIAPIVGLLLGDLEAGVRIGGAFELIFIGAAPIGGAVPPNVAVSSALGAAFAISAGGGVQEALLIGVPAAVVATSFEALAKGGCSYLVHPVDRFAKLGNRRDIIGTIWVGNAVHFLAYAIPTFLALYFGRGLVESLSNLVSGSVEDALTVAAAILPALGFGLLLSILTTRVLFPLFIVGFLLASYTDLGVIGVALLGAAIIIFIQTSRGTTEADSEPVEGESESVGGVPDYAETTLSRRDIRSLFWRSFLLQAAFNYERFQNLGWWWGFRKLLDRWYSHQGDLLPQAYQRHLVFFNTHPWVSTIVYGIVATMESRKAAGEEIDDDAIQGIKVGTMGPLAGIGDSLFFGAIRPIVSGLCASLAVVGNFLAPILFLVGINIIHFASRWYGLQYAFRYGQRVFERLGGTQLERVRESAVMVGLLVVGALVATLLPITTPLEYTVGDAQIVLQDFLDEILVGLIPLTITLVVFWLVRKGLNPLYILIALTIVGLAGGYFGLLSGPEL